MNERDKVINTLMQKAHNVPKEHEKEISDLKPVKIQNRNLPGYIPYIGKNYFSAERRILIYALSQNIKSFNGLPNTPFEKKCLEWSLPANIKSALNRQNISFKEEGIIEMYPFDTGHLPVIAAMLLYRLGIKNELSSIYNLVSATNLSKFSFMTNDKKTTDNKKSLENCFEWFSRCEIGVLKPDYIICAGNWVYNAIKKNIKKISFNDRNVLKVAFPSLQVINRWYRIENPDPKNEKDILKKVPEIDHNREVCYQTPTTLKDVIKRDSNYFFKMCSKIEEQLK
jgi:hypothetical protein